MACLVRNAARKNGHEMFYGVRVRVRVRGNVRVLDLGLGLGLGLGVRIWDQA